MWKRYFKFIKLVPGRVDTALFGILDFSRDDIPIETILALYESDFPYLKITDEGLKEFYGINPSAGISLFPLDEVKYEEKIEESVETPASPDLQSGDNAEGFEIPVDPELKTAAKTVRKRRKPAG